jgi:hypothetical protein
MIPACPNETEAIMTTTSMTTRETHVINHPIFGPYIQVVYDSLDEAGHSALPSGTRYGWGMPTDPATAEFVRSTVGKVVLEIGSGVGDTIVIPALARGASHVFATNIVRERDLLAEDSIMMGRAKTVGRSRALRTQVLDEKWWDRGLQDAPTVSSLLAISVGASLPEDGIVDLMIARHSAQFGDPDKFLRLLDLASVALRSGGTFTGINFTPYTGYMYRRDAGATIDKWASGNEAFASGDAKAPAGVTDDLRALMEQPMGKEPIPFLFFDQSTIIGLLRCWAETRAVRGLPCDLELTANYYFSPSAIARVNKLPSMPSFDKFVESENHVFVLTKIA